MGGRQSTVHRVLQLERHLQGKIPSEMSTPGNSTPMGRPSGTFITSVEGQGLGKRKQIDPKQNFDIEVDLTENLLEFQEPLHKLREEQARRKFLKKEEEEDLPKIKDVHYLQLKPSLVAHYMGQNPTHDNDREKASSVLQNIFANFE